MVQVHEPQQLAAFQQGADAGAVGPRLATQAVQLGVDLLQVFQCFVRQLRLPAIAARQVAAVPLRPDVVDVPQQPALEYVDRVVVQDAVVPLVPGGQQSAGLGGHAAHLLAFGHAVGHQLFGQHVLAGQHGLDGHLRVQVQRQGDDHRFHVGIGQQVAIVPVVNLDVAAGLVFAAPVVFPHQAGPRQKRAAARLVAVKRAVDVVRADVGNRHDPDELGVVRSDEHAPFVARADHPHPHRIAQRAVVAEVIPAQSGAGHQPGGHAAEQEVASRDAAAVRVGLVAGQVLAADEAIDVALANGDFFRRQMHRIPSCPTAVAPPRGG